MSNTATLANTQSISAVMAKGNAAAIGRMKALLKDHSAKVSKFSPPTLSFDQAATDKSRRISKAAI